MLPIVMVLGRVVRKLISEVTNRSFIAPGVVLNNEAAKSELTRGRIEGASVWSFILAASSSKIEREGRRVRAVCPSITSAGIRIAATNITSTDRTLTLFPILASRSIKSWCRSIKFSFNSSSHSPRFKKPATEFLPGRCRRVAPFSAVPEISETNALSQPAARRRVARSSCSRSSRCSRQSS